MKKPSSGPINPNTSPYRRHLMNLLTASTLALSACSPNHSTEPNTSKEVVVFDGGVDRSDESKVDKEIKSSMGKPSLDLSKTRDYCRDGHTYSGSFKMKNVDLNSLSIFAKGLNESVAVKIFNVEVSSDGTVTYDCKVAGNPGSEFIIISEALDLNGNGIKSKSDVFTIY